LNGVASPQLNESLQVIGVMTGMSGCTYGWDQIGSKPLNDLYRLRFEGGLLGGSLIKATTSSDVEA
jgi:hypothetical protein